MKNSFFVRRRNRFQALRGDGAEFNQTLTRFQAVHQRFAFHVFHHQEKFICVGKNVVNSGDA